MRKLFLTFILALGLVFAFRAPAVLAVSGGALGDACDEVAPGAEKPAICTENDQTQGTTVNPVTGDEGVLVKVANILAIVVGIIATIVMVVNGIMMILSRGDPQKVANARSAIIYAAVGIAVTVVSRSIIIFLVDRIG